MKYMYSHIKNMLHGNRHNLFMNIYQPSFAEIMPRPMRSYPRYAEIWLEMKLIKNDGGPTSFFFKKLGKNVNFENLSSVGLRAFGNFQDNDVYAPGPHFGTHFFMFFDLNDELEMPN